MDPLVIILITISIILTVLLVVLGVQAFLVLRDLRATMKRVNTIIDVIQNTALRALIPLSNMGDFIAGVKGGVRVFETFVNFLHKHEDEE